MEQKTFPKLSAAVARVVFFFGLNTWVAFSFVTFGSLRLSQSYVEPLF